MVHHNFPFQVNFDLFTKLFLVVGVCWLFQVRLVLTLFFGQLTEPFHIDIFQTNISVSFSSDACFAGHFSIGIHWENLHIATGFANTIISQYIHPQCYA